MAKAGAESKLETLTEVATEELLGTRRQHAAEAAAEPQALASEEVAPANMAAALWASVAAGLTALVQRQVPFAVRAAKAAAEPRVLAADKAATANMAAAHWASVAAGLMEVATKA